MSDEELEKDWKPSGRRPQSTMAKSFSAALDDMFKMDNSIADLDAAVAEKKHEVLSQATELEALEARLRATEERLKANGLPVAPRSPRQRIPLELFSGQQGEASEPPKTTDNNQSAQQSNTQASRPTTATRPGTGKSREPMPGGLPPTPGASEGEYYVEDSAAGRAMIADYVILNKDGQEIDEGETTPPNRHTT